MELFVTSYEKSFNSYNARHVHSNIRPPSSSQGSQKYNPGWKLKLKTVLTTSADANRQIYTLSGQELPSHTTLPLT